MGSGALVRMCMLSPGYDSAGAHVSVTRTVEVGCEDPNPGGTYGGNRVACSTIYKEMHGAAPGEVFLVCSCCTHRKPLVKTATV